VTLIWQWALVGDLTVKAMNCLELEMLWLLKFSLIVSREEYDECVGVLKSLDDSNNDMCSQLGDVFCTTEPDPLVT
jgi:hypothetical protein